MLKKIDVARLRPGMHIHKLCGSWLDIPFWTKSFQVDSNELCMQVQASGVAEAWIDTEKGLDLDDAELAPPPAAAARAPARAPVAALGEPSAAVTPTSTAREFDRAAQIVARSKAAVTSMFAEARMGRLSGVTQAGAIVDEIANSVMRNPQALVTICRLKQSDDYTYMHSIAVCAMMIALAKQLGMDDEQARRCGQAGLLHDIGKMAIAPGILNKPGGLTKDEFDRVKRHPEAGYEMLREAGGISAVALDVCLHHHEKYNGEGYPFGLRGEFLSIHSRMAAVCDVYDAITSNRPYKTGWCPAESLRRMAEWTKEGHFDPNVFGAFVKCVGIYPIGTLLMLKSGRLGVVTDISKSLMRPQVKVFFSTRSMTYLPPQLVDLALLSDTEDIVSREDARTWGITDLDQHWHPT